MMIDYKSLAQMVQRLTVSISISLLLVGCVSTGIRVGGVFIPVDTGIGQSQQEKAKRKAEKEAEQRKEKEAQEQAEQDAEKQIERDGKSSGEEDDEVEIEF